MGARVSAANGLVSRRTIRHVTGLLLMCAALPVWAAGFQLPSVHGLAPVKRSAQPHFPSPRPIIIGASYHLARSCTNPLHAISVTVRIREQGGPLKAGQASVLIYAQSQHISPIRNANDAASLIPALGLGQMYTTRQWVGTLPEYRKALPGRHTLLVEVVPQASDQVVAPKPIPRYTYRLPVRIPAGYCQPELRPATKGAVMGKPVIRRGIAHFPPSPCVTHDCLANRRTAATSALKPDLHVVSVRVRPQRSVTGTPVLVTAVIQNKGAIASTAGKRLHIYCSAYQGPNTPPTRWTCKVSAPHTSAGGMPMWDIPLPAIPGHGQADVALRIHEHWAAGLYYFTHTTPGKNATIQDLVKAKDDSIIQIDKK